MTYYRRTYANAPATVALPPEMHDRRVEVIVLPLDEPAVNGEQLAVDGLGWPARFFEEAFGSLPDYPECFLEGNCCPLPSDSNSLS